MTIDRRRTLAIALLVAAMPSGVVLAAGGGRGVAPGSYRGAVGNAATGNASGAGQSIGGGAPAGTVGGGPPAGAVGGGAVNSGVTVGPEYPTSVGPSGETSVGGVIGGYTGVPASGPPPADAGGRAPPPLTGQGQPPSTDQEQSGHGQAQSGEPTPPQDVRGVAAEPPPSTSGLATTASDGVSTRIVPARPCGVAAHETDGITTCIGIPTHR